MNPAGQSGRVARPVILFVIGFGRSGTSALTRVLSLCGAALPAGLLGATGSNPRGFWEPRAAVHLNEEILRRHGSSGYDLSLRLQDEGALDAEEKAACIAEIRAYLTTLPTAPLVVVKEPKMTALSGLWFEAARQAGFDVAAVIAVRHPAEVIGSVEKRARGQFYVRSSPELVSAWWLRYIFCWPSEIRAGCRACSSSTPTSRGLAPGGKTDFHGARDRSRRPG